MNSSAKEVAKEFAPELVGKTEMQVVFVAIASLVGRIQALELEEVDEAQGTTVDTDYQTFRTKLQLPNTLDLNFKTGFTYIGTLTGQEIQLSSEAKSRWQEYKKYTSRDRVAYLKDSYIYVINDMDIRYITVRGVFEIPSEISHLNNPNESVTDITENSSYPIPINMIPTLKQMILQGELGIMVQAPSDVINESASIVEPNIKEGVR